MVIMSQFRLQKRRSKTVSSSSTQAILIPNRTFLVRFGGISGGFGRAMVCIGETQFGETTIFTLMCGKKELF